jgi:hypothetical protein
MSTFNFLYFFVFSLLLLSSIHFLFADRFKYVESHIIKSFKVHDFSRITLLKNCPFEVILVNRVEITRETLIDVKVGNSKVGDFVPHGK